MHIWNGFAVNLVIWVPILLILVFLEMRKIISKKLIVLFSVILFFISSIACYYTKFNSLIYIISEAISNVCLIELMLLIIRKIAFEKESDSESLDKSKKMGVVIRSIGAVIGSLLLIAFAIQIVVVAHSMGIKYLVFTDWKALLRVLALILIGCFFVYSFKTVNKRIYIGFVLADILVFSLAMLYFFTGIFEQIFLR